ncbi:helix-turn-helix domain-containing protein [Lawsonibacter sp. LCP25S3_G6]|uniref:helix-turn-helix domain-containing protein n=1 Tax=unclassified Lawsonibacter TaxID=2617946 RepID=UPI003F9AC96D
MDVTLGERIYQERTARRLSQTDLAEALEVSRQSVSKWETNASVPDLDKLVKMCELFEVSMDSLVRGIEPQETTDDPPMAAAPQKEYSPNIRIVLGLMLVFFGLFVFTLLAFFRHARLDEALVWSAPLLVTGGMSLKFPKHPVLAAFWGLWGLYTLVLTPFLFLSARKVLVFFVGDLILTGVLIISTLRIKEREKDNE